MKAKILLAVSIALTAPTSFSSPTLSLINPADNSLYQLSVTQNAFSHTVNYEEKITTELGTGWSVADWRSISRNAGGGTSSYALAEFMRNSFSSGPLPAGPEAGTYFVYRDGQKYASQSPGFSRAYFATAHYQQKPSYYLAHENISNNMISLGSWDTTAQIMAQRTVAAPRISSDYAIHSTSYSPSNNFGVHDSFDPSLPTVVYTHGFERGKTFGVDTPEEDAQAAKIVNSFLQVGKGVNLISYQWKGGFTDVAPNTNLVSAVATTVSALDGGTTGNVANVIACGTDYLFSSGKVCDLASFVKDGGQILDAIQTGVTIAEATILIRSEMSMRISRDNAGLQLASQLKNVISAGYSGDIQFVGFGDGAIVSTYALRALSKSEKSEVTTGHIGISAIGIPLKDSTFELNLPSGFLDSAESYGLNNPFFLGSTRYSWARLDENLNDSQWVWHAFANDKSVEVPVWANLNSGVLVPIDLSGTPRFNQGTVTDISSLNGQVFDGFKVKENSPSSVNLLLDIPVYANSLIFDYFVSNQGDGDWFSVYFNDRLLWSILGTSFLGDDVLTAILDVSEFGGQSGTLMFALHSVGGSSAEASFGNLRFETRAVPEPTTLALVAISFLCGIRIRRKHRKALPE